MLFTCFPVTVSKRSLYSTKRVTVPLPEFYVLYNGEDPYPDGETLRLSDLFAKPYKLGLPEKARPLLELKGHGCHQPLICERKRLCPVVLLT